MSNSLVDPLDINDFPGAPFTEAAVDAAAASMRGTAQWHIAPEVTETVTVDGVSGQVLVLPTLKIVSVSEIRDVTDGGSEVITGWEIRRQSMLTRRQGWPCGIGSIEVDLTHGFASTPADLFPVAAEAAQLSQATAVSQKSVGSFSVSYRPYLSVAANDTLRRYSIHLA